MESVVASSEGVEITIIVAEHGTLLKQKLQVTRKSKPKFDP